MREEEKKALKATVRLNALVVVDMPITLENVEDMAEAIKGEKIKMLNQMKESAQKLELKDVVWAEVKIPQINLTPPLNN